MTDTKWNGLEPLARTASGHSQIHLLGFMGCGKSTVARLLARRLVWNYLDLDVLIARHAGASIAAIFASDGEAAFRDMENHVLRQVVKKPCTIVALGGGTTVLEPNRDLIGRHALSVWLRASFATCRERVGDRAERPLFGDPESARRLFDERQSDYARAAVTVSAEDSARDVAFRIEAAARGAVAPTTGC